MGRPARELLALLTIVAVLLIALPEARGDGGGDHHRSRATVPAASASAPIPERAARPALPAASHRGDLAVPIALALGALALARSRRFTALALVMLLAVLLVETGVHSVHHLGSRDDPARCVHAAAAPHLVGPVGCPDGIAVGVRPASDAVTPAAPDAARPWSRRPDASRAPPRLPVPA
jgi:hypothetical protein